MADIPRLEEAVEFAENPEPRCPCVLLLDTSGSMQGNAIAALNEGLRAFQEDLIKDPLASRRVAVAAPIPIQPRNIRGRVAYLFVLLLAVGLWGCQRAIVSLPAPPPRITSSGPIQEWGEAERVPVPAGEFPMGSREGESDGDEHPQHRVLRGGSWAGVQGHARAAVRTWLAPGSQDDGSGFRCAQDSR